MSAAPMVYMSAAPMLLHRYSRLLHRGDCLPLSSLALLLQQHATILKLDGGVLPPPILQLLVIHHVQVPSARVPRAVDAAPVSRRHLLLDALVAHRVLLPLVVHV